MDQFLLLLVDRQDLNETVVRIKIFVHKITKGRAMERMEISSCTRREHPRQNHKNVEHMSECSSIQALREDIPSYFFHRNVVVLISTPTRSRWKIPTFVCLVSWFPGFPLPVWLVMCEIFVETIHSLKKILE